MGVVRSVVSLVSSVLGMDDGPTGQAYRGDSPRSANEPEPTQKSAAPQPEYGAQSRSAQYNAQRSRARMSAQGGGAPATNLATEQELQASSEGDSMLGEDRSIRRQRGAGGSNLLGM